MPCNAGEKMPIEWIWGLLGGVTIGCAGAVYLLGNGRIMGVSGIFGGLIDRSSPAQRSERLWFLVGLVVVPAGLAAVSQTPPSTEITGNVGLILIAGVLVGLGTRIGNGCTSGHGVCGISRLSLRGIVATCLFIGSGAGTIVLARFMGLL